MGANKRLEFKLGEYLLKGIKYKFGKACFRDDIACTNTAREGIDMICIRGHRIISPREGSHENTAQIALKCLTAARRAGIGAAKKAATRANIDGAGGKAFRCRSRKGGGNAAKRILSKRSNSKRGKNEKNSTTDGFVRRRICGG